MGNGISVIVPALNEEAALPRCLGSVETGPGDEIIVVDGGSDDRTREVSIELGAKVIEGGRGRARQMNAGAEAASGGALMFLHADCALPPGGLGAAREALEAGGLAAGAFDLGIEHPGVGFRLIEFGANLRSRLTDIPYGDQALFMPAATFRALGGFKDIPLMEDIEIARRLRRMGPIAFLGPPVMTLPRRWLSEGPLYTTLRDWYIALAYTVFGTSPEALRKHYKDVR